MSYYQIAVDGPAGSGKTSIMKAVSKKLSFDFIDTGLMYRAFTKFLVENKVNFNNEAEIIDMLQDFDCDYVGEELYVNGQNYMSDLTSRYVLENINKITIIPEVREFMVKKQREIASNRNCIFTGRDITSVVLPNATVKIYLDCSIETRVKRRLEQNEKENVNMLNYDEIYNMIEKRDESDKNREIGPLIKTEDSIVIDNSNSSFGECVNNIVNIVKEKIKVI